VLPERAIVGLNDNILSIVVCYLIDINRCGFSGIVRLSVEAGPFVTGILCIPTRPSTELDRETDCIEHQIRAGTICRTNTFSDPQSN
jgi:hypothetical protein